MKQYHDLLNDILQNGNSRKDRTGVGTISLFGKQLIFNLKAGFPAITTKKLAFKSVVSELLWFIEGSCDERRLAEIHYNEIRDNLKNKNTIWTANANADYWINNAKFEGDLGRVYGVQWRTWTNKNNEVIDQFKNLLNNLKKDPYSRRHILLNYNPGELKEMCLPACHMLSQYYIQDNNLSCSVYIRSNDVFLGLPFNIASYALLTHLMALELGLEADQLILSIGDAHIYNNHLEQVKIQLSRNEYDLPKLQINKKNIFDYNVDDIKLLDYKSHDVIKADMAV